MNLRNVLIMTILLVVCMGRNLYVNRQVTLNQHSNLLSSIAISPKTVHSYFGESIDIAVEDSFDIYFYNKNYRFRYVSESKIYIDQIQWNQIGLYLIGLQQIKVVNPQFYNWTIFYIQFEHKIRNYAIGFDKQRNLFLTAVSFNETLQMYENNTMVASFNISEPCKAMKYHPNKKLFSFVASIIEEEEISEGQERENSRSSDGQVDFQNYPEEVQEEDYFCIYTVDLETNTIINKSEQLQQNQNSIAFVNVPGYDHLSVTVDDIYLHLWSNQTRLITYRLKYKVTELYFTENSDLLILVMGSNLGSIKINLENELFIDSNSNFEALQFPSMIYDIAIKGNTILVSMYRKTIWVVNPENIVFKNYTMLMMIITCGVYFILMIVVCCLCESPLGFCVGSGDYSSSSDNSNQHDWTPAHYTCGASSGCGGGGGGDGGSHRHDHG